MHTKEIKDPPFAHTLFSTNRYGLFWLIVRLYLGYEWLFAGWEKIKNPVWVGDKAGAAINGFVQGALAKTGGPHPDVSSWYAWFLQHAVIPHTVFWSYLVTYGEILVGIGLILGILTGISAFFGLFMNMNYLLAGTVSVNPVLAALAILVILGWKAAGFLGVDRFLLPFLGTPWSRKGA